MTPPTAIPPHNLDAERAVLGAMLREGEEAGGALERALRRLALTDFYTEAHRTIFRTMRALHQRGAVFDALIVIDALREAGELESVGGPAAIALVYEQATIPARVDPYIDIVLRDAGKRETIQALREAVTSAYDGATAPQIAANVPMTLDRIAQHAAPAASDRPLIVPVAQLEAPAVSYRIETLLPAGMLTLLSGRDKRGKTLLAQEMARAVLEGVPLFEHFQAHQGPVVAAFLDDPLAMTLERLGVLGLRSHPDLYIVNPLYYQGEPLLFLEALSREVLRVGAKFTIVDALYLLSPTTTDAGNDASRMTPLMRGLDALAVQTGAAVLCVAHDNKSGTDVAGSFAIRAMAKCILRLALPREEENADPDGAPTTPRRVLKVESKLVEAQAHMLDLKGPGQWRYLGTPATIRVSDLRDAIVAFVDRQAEPVPEDEIHDNVPGRREAKQQALRALVADGTVVRTGGGKKGDPFLYARKESESSKDSGTQRSPIEPVPESKTEVNPRESGANSGTRDPVPAMPRVPESADSNTPPEQAGRCPSCGGTRFWQSRAGLSVCRGCHPPAPGAEGPP